VKSIDKCKARVRFRILLHIPRSFGFEIYRQMDILLYVFFMETFPNNNIKMDLREIGWDGMDWIDLAQDRDQWKALVNFRVP
jgi:hypothetical protein